VIRISEVGLDENDRHRGVLGSALSLQVERDLFSSFVYKVVSLQVRTRKARGRQVEMAMERVAGLTWLVTR
jgi:hypothetical protein